MTPEDFEALITVHDVSDKIYLTQAVGTATYGDIVVSVSSGLDGSPIFLFPDGVQYRVDIQDLLAACWLQVDPSVGEDE